MNGDLFGDHDQVEETDGGLPSCPQKELIALYHRILPMCPKVLKWGPQRQQYLRSRWREMALDTTPELGGGYRTQADGLEWWRKFFVHCSNSRFLTGRADPRRPGESSFLATLEYLVRPTNFIRTLEGGFHRDGGKR